MGKGKPPGLIGKVNGVIDFFENPCDAPWTIYIELAFEPAKHVVIELVWTSFTDIIRGYFRPKGLRIGGHLRRHRRRGKFRKFQIPDTAELFAKAIPGREAVAARKVSQGVRTLWVIDGVIQRVFWYWLVAELTVDFFYEWTTAIQESEYCQAEATGTCTIIGSGGGTVNSSWTNVGGDDEVTESGSCHYIGLTGVSTPAGIKRAGVHSIGGYLVEWDSSVFTVMDIAGGLVVSFVALSNVRPINNRPSAVYEYGLIPGGGGDWSSGPIVYDSHNPYKDVVSPKLTDYY